MAVSSSTACGRLRILPASGKAFRIANGDVTRILYRCDAPGIGLLGLASIESLFECIEHEVQAVCMELLTRKRLDAPGKYVDGKSHIQPALPR